MNKLILSLLLIEILFSLNFVAAAEVQVFTTKDENIKLIINCTTSDCNELCTIHMYKPDGSLRFDNAYLTTDKISKKLNITISSGKDNYLKKGDYDYTLNCINTNDNTKTTTNSKLIIKQDFELFSLTNLFILIVVLVVIIIISIVIIRNNRITRG